MFVSDLSQGIHGGISAPVSIGFWDAVNPSKWVRFAKETSRIMVARYWEKKGKKVRKENQ